jgi:hypothetical protein
MKKFLTSLLAMDNREGRLAKFAGPVIEAESLEAAQTWCNLHARYLIVEQEISVIKTWEQLASAN